METERKSDNLKSIDLLDFLISRYRNEMLSKLNYG